MIWRTIGAATVPPSPSELTTITATAIFGFCGRGEGREPGVGLLRRLLAGAELLAGLERRGAELGGAGLAGDLDPGQGGGDPGARTRRPPIISSVIVAAVSGEVTSTGLAARARAPRSAGDRGRHPHALVGDRLRDRRHLQRRRQHLALADRRFAGLDAVGEVGRDRARGRVDDPRSSAASKSCGGSLKPNSSDVSTSFGPAELGAERREDRVARVGEALGEGAAARLVVGVGDLAADLGVRRLDRELVVEADDPGVERPGRGDDLEGRTRGLRAPSRRARRAPRTRALAGVDHRGAAVGVAERRHRALLDLGVDVRADRFAADRLGWWRARARRRARPPRRRRPRAAGRPAGRRAAR